MRAPFVVVAVEEVVVAKREIEEAPRRDAGWIVIVVLPSDGVHFDEIGPKIDQSVNSSESHATRFKLDDMIPQSPVVESTTKLGPE